MKWGDFVLKKGQRGLASVCGRLSTCTQHIYVFLPVVQHFRVLEIAQVGSLDLLTWGIVWIMPFWEGLIRYNAVSRYMA